MAGKVLFARVSQQSCGAILAADRFGRQSSRIARLSIQISLCESAAPLENPPLGSIESIASDDASRCLRYRCRRLRDVDQRSILASYFVGRLVCARFRIRDLTSGRNDDQARINARSSASGDTVVTARVTAVARISLFLGEFDDSESPIGGASNTIPDSLAASQPWFTRVFSWPSKWPEAPTLSNGSIGFLQLHRNHNKPEWPPANYPARKRRHSNGIDSDTISAKPILRFMSR